MPPKKKSSAKRRSGVPVGRPKGTKNRAKLYAPPAPPPVPYNGPPEDEPLTPSEERFVANYLIDNNATRAYHESYPGCTYRTASVSGCHLIAKHNVAAEIREGQAALLRRFKMNAEEAIQELLRCAFADPADWFDSHDNLLPLRRIPIHARRAISSVRVRRERTIQKNKTTMVKEQVIEYRMTNKLDALLRICDYLGIRRTGIPDLEAVLSLLPKSLSDRMRSQIVEANKQAATIPTSGEKTVLPAVVPATAG
jgi:phage terminase small subunit